MLKYLRSLHQLRNSSSLVVMGNQSADMDSCCTAIMTAYLITAIEGRPSVPMIQIEREDLKLRKDITYVFRSLGIEESWLLFKDDINLTDSTPLFLVDHNGPTMPGTPIGVIDHHAIEDPSLDMSSWSPRKLVKCGSCMSAVINYFAHIDQAEILNSNIARQDSSAAHSVESSSAPPSTKIAHLFQSDPVMAPLALAPIVQDTGNLTSKVEQEDIDAVAYLRDMNSTLNLFSPFTQFPTMKEEKRNLDGFTAEDLLRKDYKRWGDIGISSLPKLFEKLAKMDFDVADALEEFKTKTGLKVMIALASGTRGPQKIYIRQLAIAAPLDFDVAEGCPDLQLELLATRTTKNGKPIRYYNQRNTNANRKVVAPDVKRLYAEYTK